eukprot:1021783-Rhodomonas_salina.5
MRPLCPSPSLHPSQQLSQPHVWAGLGGLLCTFRDGTTSPTSDTPLLVSDSSTSLENRTYSLLSAQRYQPALTFFALASVGSVQVVL